MRFFRPKTGEKTALNGVRDFRCRLRTENSSIYHPRPRTGEGAGAGWECLPDPLSPPAKRAQPKTGEKGEIFLVLFARHDGQKEPNH